jgi:hypothetical protein
MNCVLAECPPILPGSTACHCAACHQTYGTLTLFDAHQDRSAGWGTTACRLAVDLGLVQDHKGTWQTPEGLIFRARKRESLAERRRAS